MTLRQRPRRLCLNLGLFARLRRAFQQLQPFAVVLGDAPGRILHAQQASRLGCRNLTRSLGQLGQRGAALNDPGLALLPGQRVLCRLRQTTQDDGQGNAADRQRVQDAAGRQEDQCLALRKQRAIVEQQGHRQRTGQRDGAADTCQGSRQGLPHRGWRAALASHVGAPDLAVHAHPQPDPAQGQQCQRDHQRLRQRPPPIAAGRDQRFANDLRQLQAQQQENRSVEDRFDQRPQTLRADALGDKILPLQVRDVDRDASRDRGQNARRAHPLANHVGRERQQNEQQGHLHRHHVAQAARHGIAQPGEPPAHRRAQRASAQSRPQKFAGRRGPRERTGHGGGNGKLQGDQPRGVVEHGLAIKHMTGSRRHAQSARDGAHRHRVGGGEHGGEREGHAQRHLGQHPVNQVAHARQGEKHQPQRCREDGPHQGKQLAFRDTGAIGKQQRRHEQKQKDFRIQPYVHPPVRPGQRNPHGDLDQGQRNGRQIASDNASQRRQQKDQEDQLDGLHRQTVVCQRPQARQARPGLNVRRACRAAAAPASRPRAPARRSPRRPHR